MSGIKHIEIMVNWVRSQEALNKACGRLSAGMDHLTLSELKAMQQDINDCFSEMNTATFDFRESLMELVSIAIDQSVKARDPKNKDYAS